MTARLFLVLIWLSSVLLPVAGRAQETLSTLTGETFSKWLTGTEWKGEKDGKGAHLWFATPGIVIWRWEFNPGVWDCRAVTLIYDGKGKLKWRWNPDAVAPCSLLMAEDLKSLALEDALCGKWTLTPSGRKSAAVTGGKLATLGAAGFSSWLEKQSLTWRDATVYFGKRRKAGWDKSLQGTYEIVAPGVVEFFPLKDRSDCLLVIFAPSLHGALMYTTGGVAAYRVNGAPPTAVIPAPVFNDPEPTVQNLAAMTKEDFEKWLVGTEWEHIDNNHTSWYWFPVPEFVTWRGDRHLGFGAAVTASGNVRWNWPADPAPILFNLENNLADGEYVWASGARRAKNRLIARRMPFAMNCPSSEAMAKTLPGLKVWQAKNGFVSFPGKALAKWNGSDGKFGDLNLSIPGPGMALWSVPGNPAHSGLIIFRSLTLARNYIREGALDGAIEALSQEAAAAAGSLFDMGLADTKTIPLKNPTASVNALVVVDLGGGRMAGALSKLSFTSLAQTKDDAATLVFNQPVGEDMKKALREVTRFHAIRHQGWPRGQKMELTFADKYSPKDGPSAAVACGLLLESALRGVALQPDFAVTGDMNADGSVQPIGGVGAKLRGATKGGCKVAAVPAKNTTEATDLALTDGAAPFLGIQVFSISHFDDAVKLAVRDDAPLRAVMDSFSAIAAKIKASPATLRHPDTVAALRRLSRQAPNHLSVRLLLAMAGDNLPAALSPFGSLNAIELAITDALEGTSQELLARSNLDRGKISSARSRLQQLRGKLDKRTHSLTDAWVAWCQSVERIASAGGKVDEKGANEHNATVRRINAEEERLRANADFREDLMR